MLTETEYQLAGDFVILRRSEQGIERWAATQDELLPEAHRLWERGYLDRSWDDDGPLWRCSDACFITQALVELVTTEPCPN